ncbi:hypothetical protein [Streptomyces fuscigenes]|uniref:hypothetical protein n=1 Tax=Streptomyces fuscigenes TaxID=1528880 RepID=UPI001F39B112|nr:hypothetical protein [Streptomyces fuscigenes]MCF3964257.1 hypothetical protein [Streptomyces fuscigenes]
MYLDAGYRDEVLDELHLHEERFPAPSAGFDAARVLLHAVRARRFEVGWACVLVVLWFAAALVEPGAGVFLWWGTVWMALAPWIRGRAAHPHPARLVLGFLARWFGRLTFLSALTVLVGGLFGAGGDGPAALYDGPIGSDGFGGGSGGALDGLDGPGGLRGAFLPSGAGGQGMSALALFLLVLIVAAVAARRGQFASVMAGELSRSRFPALGADPAERIAGNPRLAALRDRLRAEQHAPLSMYRSGEPFCGYGLPFDVWSLSVELRPRDGVEALPVDNAEMLRRVRPLVEALRVPSPRATGREGEAVRDRLRELVVDECVFLPADGMSRRDGAPYAPHAVEEHRAAAVEEGGESRRHFLRVRVGGWHEEVVVTVFVRVHTQGGMLMVEFAPHVLLPVRPDFRDADRQAHRHLRNSPAGRIAWALAHAGAAPAAALPTLARSVIRGWRRLTGGYARGLPEGPALSVRELGSDTDLSRFQEMDVRRYVRSIEDRVAGGVRAALREAGYATGEFEQRIIQVSGRGVFIENAKDSAIGIGDHNAVSVRDEKETSRDQGR